MLAPRISLSIAALVMLGTFLGSAAFAQSVWLPPATNSQVRLEAMKAIYKESNGVTLMTTAWFWSSWLQMGRSAVMYVEVPFSLYDEADFDAQQTPGNPYVGFVFGSIDRKGGVVEAGGRFPVIDDASSAAAIVNGWVTDVTRMEAFVPQAMSLKLRAGGFLVSDTTSGVFLRIMAGGQLWIATSGEGSELLTDVDMSVWKLADKSSLGAILSAKSLLSESGLSLSERSEFQLGLTGTVRFGRVEPGAHVHLPLGNDGLLGIGELVDVVLGIDFTVHLSDK